MTRRFPWLHAKAPPALTYQQSNKSNRLNMKKLVAKIEWLLQWRTFAYGRPRLGVASQTGREEAAECGYELGPDGAAYASAVRDNSGIESHESLLVAMHDEEEMPAEISEELDLLQTPQHPNHTLEPAECRGAGSGGAPKQVSCSPSRSSLSPSHSPPYAAFHETQLLNRPPHACPADTAQPANRWCPCFMVSSTIFVCLLPPASSLDIIILIRSWG